MTDVATARLDDFTDAAFAFAVTLLLIAGGAELDSYAELVAAMRNVPAFLVGFALICSFWHGHVRWRRLGADAGGLSTLLTLALVFLVLIYVYPLRLMADSLAAYATGMPSRLATADLPGVFTIYGVGFAAMALLEATLFAAALRAPGLPAAARESARDEAVVWSIQAGTGALSASLAQLDGLRFFAPFTYLLLPVVIPLYHARRSRPGAPR